MAATITTVVDPDITPDNAFPVTRRELGVLAVALAVVIGAIFLLLVTSGQVVAALFGHG